MLCTVYLLGNVWDFILFLFIFFSLRYPSEGWATKCNDMREEGEERREKKVKKRKMVRRGRTL